jgi:hypothetical protein
MGRSNVIIVGSVVLAPLVLGLESYLLFRTHHRRARTTEVTGSIEPSAPMLPGPTFVPNPTVPVAAQRRLPPPEPRPAAAVAADSPTDTETVSDVQTDPTVERRRQLMLRRRGEILQAADEQVFGQLRLPDEQRAAIRVIDSAYARTLQAIGELGPDADLRSAGLDPNAEQARRSAIGEVLGPNVTHAFNLAERKAERRVRNQFRVEEVRGR